MSEIVEPEVKSTHKCEIVPIVLEKHPNADSLSIVNVFGGYTCCVNTEQWQGVKLGAYVPPDSSVDTIRSEFAFLYKDSKQDGRARVKAKKLRGVVSFGLLVPAPDGAKEGDNVAQQLDVQHYEPPVKMEGGSNKAGLYMGGEVAPGPNVYHVKYDVDAFRRYHSVFKQDEPVFVTEKIDGSNSRYVFHDGKMYCGSRTEWKKEFPSFDHVTVENLVAKGVEEAKAKEIVEMVRSKPKKRNVWWEVLDRTPTLENFCRKYPDHIVYGEVFGNVGRIKYGITNTFAAFDVMKDGKWLDAGDAFHILRGEGVPCVPVLSVIPYSFDKICQLAEGMSLVPGADVRAIREGCVVKPIVERAERSIGRVQLKCVSSEYLERF